MSIHEACLDNNLLLLKQLTSNKKNDINELDEDKRTPLFCACFSGSFNCLDYLLGLEGIDAEKKSKGIPPFHIAGLHNKFDCLKRLQESGINVNVLDDDGSTLLHKGCNEGNKPLVLLLLDSKDIDINVLDQNKMSPLHLATNFGSGTIVQALVRKGANLDLQNSKGQTPFHIAIDHSNSKIVNYLIKKGSKTDIIDFQGSSPLHIASWTGDKEIFDLLLDNNKKFINDQDAEGMTCLSLASEQGHTYIVSKLLQMNGTFQPDHLGETPIHKASLSSHAKTLETLLEHKQENNKWGVDFEDAKKNTALSFASQVGSLDCIKLLVKHGASINHADKDGLNALHKASLNGHDDVVLYLLENSDLLNKGDNKNITPLHKASLNGKIETIKILCNGGADVNATDYHGRVPLHCAVLSGSNESIKAILPYLKFPESLLERDNDGFNSLHLAISSGLLNTVKFLLELENTPLDVNDVVVPGLSPFILSLKYKHLDVAKHLLQCGATYHTDNDFKNSLIDIDPEIIKALIKEKELMHKSQKGLFKILKRTSQKIRGNVKRNDSTSSDTYTKKRSDIDKLDSEKINNIDSSPLSQTNDPIRSKSSSFAFHTVSIRSRSKRRATILKTPDIDEALEEFNKSPQKGIDNLIEKEIIEDSPSSIARFLFERDGIDKTKLGLYLSEGSTLTNEVLDAFVRLMEFSNMEFDMALRRFLTKFRLPGEAQKIDRLMEKFAERYYMLNPEIGPFKSQDSIYILSFSVIMLNTDAHSPAIKKQNKMTKKQFIANNSGINSGDDFPEKFLSDLYDKIVTYEIKMESDEHEYLHADLKGWLSIQGSGVKTWKKRWFVLADNCLFYFKSTVDKDPYGIIPLENIIIQQYEGKKKFLFEMKSINEGPIKASLRKASGFIVANHDSYTFLASTYEEMSLWMESLNRNIFRNPFNQLMALKKKELENKKPVSSPSKTFRKAKSSKME